MATIATGAAPLPQPAPVHFTEAINFLRDKQRLPTRTWTDLWQDMHARAFVVAGAMKDQLVADFHTAVTAAIAEGRTLADFRKDFDRIVAAHGWSYNGSRNWRSRVIYQTNMRMAYNAGRFAQAQRLKERRPFLRYVAVLDSRTRPEHRAWHDTVLPVDHEFWSTHHPPNGWNCRCTVQSLSRGDMERFQISESDGPPPVQIVKRQVNTPSGKVTVPVPQGIDPGFAYNPGEAAFGRGANLMAMERHGGFTALEAPGAAGTRAALRLEATPTSTRLAPPIVKADEAALRAALRRAIGADEAIFTDPTGARVSVTQALADHLLEDATRIDGRNAFWPLIPELIEQPQEIWVGFAKSDASGRVALRRRYVRLFELGKDRVIGLVADEANGYWQAMTFFRGDPIRSLNNLRVGVPVYRAG